MSDVDEHVADRDHRDQALQHHVLALGDRGVEQGAHPR